LHAGKLYQILAYDDIPPLKGAWSESREPIFKFCTNHIFVIGEARHFKFRVLIDTEELTKGMCSESRDFFKFLEMSDNISEMVQDRDIVAIKN